MPYQQPGAAGGDVQQNGQDDVEAVAVAEPVQAEAVQRLPGGERHDAEHGGEGVAVGRDGEQGERDPGRPQHGDGPGGRRPGAQRADERDQHENPDRPGPPQRQPGPDQPGDQGHHQKIDRPRRITAQEDGPGPHHGLGTYQQDRNQPVVGSIHNEIQAMARSAPPNSG